jgi:hypothetical protein
MKLDKTRLDPKGPLNVVNSELQCGLNCRSYITGAVGGERQSSPTGCSNFKADSPQSFLHTASDVERHFALLFEVRGNKQGLGYKMSPGHASGEPEGRVMIRNLTTSPLPCFIITNHHTHTHTHTPREAMLR